MLNTFVENNCIHHGCLDTAFELDCRSFILLRRKNGYTTRRGSERYPRKEMKKKSSSNLSIFQNLKQNCGVQILMVLIDSSSKLHSRCERKESSTNRRRLSQNLQFTSSVPSRQSFSPSQRQPGRIHFPFPHENSSTEQVAEIRNLTTSKLLIYDARTICRYINHPLEC